MEELKDACVWRKATSCGLLFCCFQHLHTLHNSLLHFLSLMMSHNVALFKYVSANSKTGFVYLTCWRAFIHHWSVVPVPVSSSVPVRSARLQEHIRCGRRVQNTVKLCRGSLWFLFLFKLHNHAVFRRAAAAAAALNDAPLPVLEQVFEDLG